MAQGKHQTRKERALEAQRQRERRQRFRLGGISLAAVVLLGLFFWLGNRPNAVDGDSPAGADSTAWGPVNAPVLIEEWSDFN